LSAMLNWSVRLLDSQSFEVDIYISLGAIWFISGQIQVKSAPSAVELPSGETKKCPYS
jgi:hypothetical protein